jgi:two-component system chemotaxis response regulator CheY
MIVDDDKFLLDMYSMKFTGAGHKVIAASSAQDALQKLRGGDAPDILVLDIIMPAMDGLELLETVRKENLVPAASVVMLTNETDPARIEKAKSLGVAGYIVKATTIPSEVVKEVVSLADKPK